MRVKKPGRVLRSVFGWLMIVCGGFRGAIAGLDSILTLLGLNYIDYSLGKRLIIVEMELVMAVGFFAILWLGFRLKNGGRKDEKAPPVNENSNVVKPNYSENIRNFRDYIHNALLSRYGGAGGKHLVPAKLEGNGIHVKSAALLEWLKCNPLAGQYELYGVMLLTEKEPVITLYEDGVKTREYRLQTENEEDFTGKYFHIGIRMRMHGNPSIPVAQIDGFLSDTPEDRRMTSDDIGYRMEGHFLNCGGENAKVRREINRGQDLPMKALKYVGYTTPSSIRMIGICPDCGKSFSFHSYCVYMAQYDVAYSDDGQDCCQIADHNVANDDWKYEVDGKTFRYYNSFCCPHCGTPYIDYRKFPGNKKFGVCGCVHLGRKIYTAES